MPQILDGKATAAAIKNELTERVEALKARGITPGLGTVLVGDDPASHSYVGAKHRDCADYDTTVTFISAEELAAEHAGIPHGGSVIRRGHTSEGVAETVSFELQLDSNPEFTGSVLVATARAVARLAARGETGARTVFDVTLADLSPTSPEELRAHYL